MNFKTNKTKLIARVMLLVLLATSVLTLTACPGYGYIETTINCYSYKEMLDYANNHKTKFKSDKCEFLLFDVDRFENIQTKSYIANTWWHDPWSELFNIYNVDNIANDHHPFYIISSFIMNDPQIEEAYYIECQLMGTISHKEETESTSGIHQRALNETMRTKNYNYRSRYSVFVQNNVAIDIDIYHNHTATQEKLDAIVQIFMDNAVIIE